MYKKAGEKMQRKADGLLTPPVNAASLQMTDAQQYEMIKKQLQDIELKILRGEGNCRNLGKQKFVLQTHISRLKPKIKMIGLNQIFMDEAKRLLPRSDWEKIMESSRHIWRLRNKQERNDPISEQIYIQAGIMGVEL